MKWASLIRFDLKGFQRCRSVWTFLDLLHCIFGLEWPCCRFVFCPKVFRCHVTAMVLRCVETDFVNNLVLRTTTRCNPFCLLSVASGPMCQVV